MSDKTAAHADRRWPSAWPPFARGSALGAISAPHRCVCVYYVSYKKEEKLRERVEGVNGAPTAPTGAGGG
eukprot:scaffold22411_cov110-Isochrysis_galbana.AAC.7